MRIEALGESGRQADRADDHDGPETRQSLSRRQETDTVGGSGGNGAAAIQGGAAPIQGRVRGLVPARWESDEMPQDARPGRVLRRPFAEEVGMRVCIWADGGSLGCGWFAEVDGQAVESRGVVVVDLTSNASEYQASIEACNWLKGKRYRGATLKVDSKLVYMQTLGKWHCEAPTLLKMRDKLRRLVNELDVHLEWVPSEENRAHEAAQQPLRAAQCRARAEKIAARQGVLL